MKRRRFTVGQIIRMLREAEVHLSQGKSIKLVSRKLRITEQTYYHSPEIRFELDSVG
jgi:putative transposase